MENEFEVLSAFIAGVAENDLRSGGITPETIFAAVVDAIDGIGLGDTYRTFRAAMIDDGSTFGLDRDGNVTRTVTL